MGLLLAIFAIQIVQINFSLLLIGRITTGAALSIEIILANFIDECRASRQGINL